MDILILKEGFVLLDQLILLIEHDFTVQQVIIVLKKDLKASCNNFCLVFLYFARHDFVCSPMTTIYNLHVTHLNQPTYWIQQSKLAEKKNHLAHNIITYMFRNHSCMDQVHLVQARLNTITSSFHTVHSWGCVYALIELYTRKSIV